MGNSLFDQLKKTGLVDEKKAKQAKQSQYKKKKQKKGKKGAEAELSEAAVLAQQSQAEKVERDRELNRQQKEMADNIAIAAQIRQLIETNRVTETEGDVVFNFTDEGVVKRLHVAEQIHKHLVAGRLSIVRFDETYALIPAPVAEKINSRDSRSVIVSEIFAEAETDTNDPYADYKIPDDLMW